MPAGNLYTPHLDSRDLIAGFYPKLEASMESIWAPRISMEIPSDRETEELAWLGQVPVMNEWIGGRKENHLNKYSLSITNHKYEATLPISTDDLRRDKTGQIAQRISDLAVRTATHWNSLIGTFITNGEAGTSGLAYDGQFFFDTDHNESGSSQTNDLTATEVPAADVTTASTLTTTEAANILTQTIAYMQSLTDDQSQPINQGATDVLVICTKVGHYVGMKQALSLANLGTGSGNNNPVLAWSGWNISVEYVPTRITAADKLYFFFGTPAMGSTPLLRTEEFGVKTSLIGAGSEEEFKNARHLFGVEANRGVAYGMWQKAALVTLS
jgi:phage major head subunit gpT-like protein